MSSGRPSKLRGTPAAELEIDETLVRQLLSDQHPDLAQSPLQPVNAGWDNAMFCLGSQLTVRLPRRQVPNRTFH